MSHHHSHPEAENLSFDEKMIKLLEHWIKHNDSHEETYRVWAEKAKENDKARMGVLLQEAACATRMITEKFKGALLRIGDRNR